ncbi:MAG: HAMP domain-containing histidine kinase [bacterium]|nr:HAMP domain-containing histidine kinase [bacterium]
MSLRTRIALIASAAVAVAVLAIAVTVYLTTEDRLVEEVDQSLTDRLGAARAFEGLSDELRDRGGPRGRTGPFQVPRGFDVLYVQLTAGDGTVISVGEGAVELPVAPEGLRAGETVFTEATVDGLHLRIANVDLGGDRGVLQLARSLSEVDATLAALTLALTLIGVIGVGAAALLGLFVARSSLRPIGELTVAAEKVAATKLLAERIDNDRDDELGRLAGAFNEMMEALESSRDQQRRLVRDAGHELRTPLTALRTNIELLAKADSLPDHDRSALLDDLSTELAELTDLVNEVVEVASETETVEPESEVALEDVAHGVVARFRRRATQDVTLRVESPASVVGRRSRLERALGNLIDNAIKWSPAESAIDVSVVGARVVVADAGPGIAPDELERVWDRFYRASDARSQPGSGLGLAIVKEIVDSHGGVVFMEDNTPTGLRIGFELPNDPQPSS